MQLEDLVAKGVQEARKYIQEKRRERALLSLRKNKLYEHNLDKIDAYLLNVEQVILLQECELAELAAVSCLSLLS